MGSIFRKYYFIFWHLLAVVFALGKWVYAFIDFWIAIKQQSTLIAINTHCVPENICSHSMEGRWKFRRCGGGLKTNIKLIRIPRGVGSN